MEKEKNQNQENTTTETSDETIGAEQQPEDKQEENKSVEEEKELSPEEKIKELEKTKDSKYLPKYFLIQILSDFKLTNDTILFINNLKIGEINYSETKSKDRFTEILKLLENTKDISERNKTSVLKTPYRYRDNSDHFFVLLLPKENTDITFIKTLVSNFNLNDYSTDILEINTVLLGLDQHLLIVKTFNSTKKVERYAGMLLSNSSLLKELNKSNFNKIIISFN